MKIARFTKGPRQFVWNTGWNLGLALRHALQEWVNFKSAPKSLDFPNQLADWQKVCDAWKTVRLCSFSIKIAVRDARMNGCLPELLAGVRKGVRPPN